jgi:hypothetical protein
MNIVIIAARVLFGLLGALLVFGGGRAILLGLHVLPGPTMGGPTAALIFGAVFAAIGALLVYANLRSVRLALFLDGAVAILMGGVWFLQGLSMFPGQSFMNGDIKWTVIGGIFALAGVGLIFAGVRRPTPAAA